MSSILDAVVDRYLDWRAFTGSGDPLLDVSDDSSVNEIKYGDPGKRRVKTFDEDTEVISFFNSRLKSKYQNPDDFTIGDSQEAREYVGGSAGGLGHIEDSWALDVPDSLLQLRQWIRRDANLEVGPYQPKGYKVCEDETIEEAAERATKAELERTEQYRNDLEEEFEDQSIEYLSAATVKAVSDAYTSEDTPSVEWYKEQQEDEKDLFSL
ncbi:MAG: hypothetical protein J07AB43_10430 [Candidatus Nanosalina sp. J07AB43]|jgi:hypothetical protein|nr:MAG: hypothetical protein J07AB43_10430 [Candidatus Nanosalina sp. J07AB43]